MSEDEYLVEAKRWLQYAKEDLELAESIFEIISTPSRNICWLAQ